MKAIGRRRRWLVLALVFPLSAWGVDTEETGSVDPEFGAGRRAIAEQRWEAAIAHFESAALRDTRNADIQNYLGYANRKLSRMGAAFKHYEQALKLNPRHRGAHEYAGEASLITGDLAGAEKHLDALRRICLLPCEEFDELKRAVAEYKARQASR